VVWLISFAILSLAVNELLMPFRRRYGLDPSVRGPCSHCLSVLISSPNRWPPNGIRAKVPCYLYMNPTTNTVPDEEVYCRLFCYAASRFISRAPTYYGDLRSRKYVPLFTCGYWNSAKTHGVFITDRGKKYVTSRLEDDNDAWNSTSSVASQMPPPLFEQESRARPSRGGLSPLDLKIMVGSR
jgi:hypothetical protein